MKQSGFSGICIKLAITAFLMLYPLISLAQQPVIDGILDDDIWDDAELISDFRVTIPYTLSNPPRNTTLHYAADENGLYFGFTNYQSAEESAGTTTLRDAPIQSDYNEVIIDFDASGDRAFGFKVSRQNSIQDSVWTNENDENTDWDGNWQHAVSATDSFWVSEIFVPWDITVFGEATGNRQVGLYFSRWHEGLRQQFSFPDVNNSQQVFLNDFAEREFQVADSTGLDFFPYVRANQDLITHKSSYDAGIDIFWKPTANRQLNVAINPDFGQVESNELVVNFSAIETFFSEKRPFFRENHELFDIQGPETLRVIHTPNIGGQADIGGEVGGIDGGDGVEGGVGAEEGNEVDEEGSDILAAARFTQIGQAFDFGVLAAQEEDKHSIEGREYTAARAQYRRGQGKVGLLLSRVERPAINRSAQTSSLDFLYNFEEDFRVSGQFIHSEVDTQNGVSISDNAWWLTGEWQPVDSVSHELTLFDYGRNLDISDFGFVTRVNREQLEYEFEKEWSDLDYFSFRDATLGFGIEYGVNEQNDQLPRQFEVNLELITESAAQWEFDTEIRTSGIDDLITRGRNPVKLPSAFASGVSFNSARDSRFSWGASLDAGNEGLQEKFFEFGLAPQLQLTEQINLALELEYVNNDSWLIFLEDNDLGEFKREEFAAALNFSAQFGSRHQLSIKLETVALEAKAIQGYTADPDGNLLINTREVSDFSLSEFAFQARYRYELGPLSEIFLVYSRGGEFERDDLGSDFFDLTRNSAGHPDTERLLFKIKRQF